MRMGVGGVGTGWFRTAWRAHCASPHCGMVGSVSARQALAGYIRVQTVICGGLREVSDCVGAWQHCGPAVSGGADSQCWQRGRHHVPHPKVMTFSGQACQGCASSHPRKLATAEPRYIRGIRRNPAGFFTAASGRRQVRQGCGITTAAGQAGEAGQEGAPSSSSPERCPDRSNATASPHASRERER